VSQPEQSSEIVETDTTHTVLVLRGEHDRASTVALTAALDRAIAAGEGELVIDLRRVEFMDAATVGVVLRASQQLTVRGRKLVLRAPSSSARRLINLCGIEGLLEPFRSATLSPERTGALGSWVQVTPTPLVKDCSEVGSPHGEAPGNKLVHRARAPAVDEPART
jgi:anti-sigma B factor antagonist